MARLGITYTEVAAAAAELTGQGQLPTIERIRFILGTGSSTTIANHLRQWKENHDSDGQTPIKENLPQELVAMVKGLWERVVSQSAGQVTAIQQDHEKLINELQQELQKYKRNNHRWQQLYNRWLKQKDQLLDEKLAIEQAFNTLDKNHISLQVKQDALLQQLQEKQERIEELHRLHKQLQANFDYIRQTNLVKA